MKSFFRIGKSPVLGWYKQIRRSSTLVVVVWLLLIMFILLAVLFCPKLFK
ncbi:MAG: hypothetical protein HQK60_12485 [Deltaproteobacteria bacterium]|nr:hypothetical protein [Deltaproteobacteria bacterium]